MHEVRIRRAFIVVHHELHRQAAHIAPPDLGESGRSHVVSWRFFTTPRVCGTMIASWARWVLYSTRRCMVPSSQSHYRVRTRIDMIDGEWGMVRRTRMSPSDIDGSQKAIPVVRESIAIACDPAPASGARTSSLYFILKSMMASLSLCVGR